MAVTAITDAGQQVCSLMDKYRHGGKFLVVVCITHQTKSKTTGRKKTATEVVSWDPTAKKVYARSCRLKRSCVCCGHACFYVW